MEQDKKNNDEPRITFGLKKSNWKVMCQLKIDWEKRNFDDVVKELFKRAKVNTHKKRGETK